MPYLLQMFLKLSPRHVWYNYVPHEFVVVFAVVIRAVVAVAAAAIANVGLFEILGLHHVHCPRVVVVFCQAFL